MRFTVIFNSIHYESEVELQVAMDYIKYRARREIKTGHPWNAAIVSAETGEIVFETAG